MIRFFIDPFHAAAAPSVAASEALELGAAMGELLLSSMTTVAYRMPHFFSASFGSVSGQKEVRKAMSEKFAALHEAQKGTALAMMRLGLAVSSGSATTTQVRHVAAVAHASLAPASRRASANAKRLTAASRR